MGTGCNRVVAQIAKTLERHLYDAGAKALGYLHHAVRTPGIGDDDLVGPQDTIHRCSYLLRFVEGDDVGSDFWLNGATHLDFSSFSSRGSACYRQSDANGHVL